MALPSPVATRFAATPRSTLSSWPTCRRLARFWRYNTFITGTRGGLLKKRRATRQLIDANPQFGVARLIGNPATRRITRFKSRSISVRARSPIQASYVRSKTLGDYGWQRSELGQQLPDVP